MSMSNSDSILHKPCGNFAQTTLPDSREFKGDLLVSVRQALSALYVLENHLVEALDRDEEGRQ